MAELPDIAEVSERILAGPALRRLDQNQVCVWVALQSEGPVTLHVRQSRDPGPTVEATATPERVGEKLWIVVISVAAPGGVYRPGETYEYWLSGPGIPSLGDPWWANTLALSGAQLPSFVGIPSTITDFRFATTSCRKPHGIGRDALPLLLPDLHDPAKRPHLLLLTGDQIYADDVVAPLFLRIRQISEALVGVDEHDPFAPDGQWPLANGRDDICKAFGLSGGANHLWTLGEFLAMYLMVWSDVLWPAEFPSFEEVWNSGQVAGYADAEADVFDPAQALAGRQACERRWNEEVRAIRAYQSTLADVRRLLANIPSLMMMDDHEVSDDWNLSHVWTRDVALRPTGRRLVANALLAYLICQHWGNDPARFQGARAENLCLANTWKGGDSPQDRAMMLRLGAPLGVVDETTGERVGEAGTAEFQQVGQAILDWRDLDRGIWVPNGLEAPGWSMGPSASLRFDLRIGPESGYPVHVVLLDERTCRRFVDAEHVGRIVPAALDRMWPKPTTEQVNAPIPPTILVAPAPVLGLPVLEHVLQPLLALSPGGAPGNDVEGWGVWSEGYEYLLARAHEWKRTVVLSGDIHFGYTSKLTYRAGGRSSFLAQFVVSSSKHPNTKSGIVHLIGDTGYRANLVRTRSWKGYSSPFTEQQLTGVPDSPTPAAVPYDVFLDVFFGRLLRYGTAPHPVLPVEAVAAFGLTGVPATHEYTLEQIDDESHFESAPNHPLAQRMAAAPTPGAGWNAQRSLAAIDALQANDLHRIGRVLQGLAQVAILHFRAENGHLVVHQRMLIALGDAVEASGALVPAAALQQMEIATHVNLDVAEVAS